MNMIKKLNINKKILILEFNKFFFLYSLSIYDLIVFDINEYFHMNEVDSLAEHDCVQVNRDISQKETLESAKV